jgi:broad specificity phosphatase PhoE
LTEEGKHQAEQKVVEIKKLPVTFHRIVTSPLLRAVQVGEIFAHHLKLPVEVFEYLKEQNKYGILSGMNTEEATEKYPAQAKRCQKGQTVEAGESWLEFKKRVLKSMFLFTNYRSDIIAVTHGGYLKTLCQIYFNEEVKKVENYASVLVELTDEGQLRKIETQGITF